MDYLFYESKNQGFLFIAYKGTSKWYGTSKESNLNLYRQSKVMRIFVILVYSISF